MELKNTVNLMISKDYKDRFKAEYLQLKIRIEKLKNMLLNWDRLTFTPSCDKRTLKSQLVSMEHYLTVLKKRAEIEGIDLGSSLEENDYREKVDEILEVYKSKHLDWWSWDDFKNYLKFKFIQIYGKSFDFRSVEGREILHYAKDKWENEEW